LIGDPTELEVVNQPHGDEMDGYERLLSDTIGGDGTLFAGQDGVEAAWAVVQPVLVLVTPVHDYQPGTWGPSGAEKLTRVFAAATALFGCYLIAKTENRDDEWLKNSASRPFDSKNQKLRME
jgi:hypothetical protein